MFAMSPRRQLAIEMLLRTVPLRGPLQLARRTSPRTRMFVHDCWYEPVGAYCADAVPNPRAPSATAAAVLRMIRFMVTPFDDAAIRRGHIDLQCSHQKPPESQRGRRHACPGRRSYRCLLYTSDAADD